MEISHRATEALVTSVIGLAVVIVVRMSLDFAYNRYERRLKQRDPMAVARRRTTFNFSRRVIVALVAAVAVWSVLSLYDVTAEIGKALLASSAVLALFAGLAFSTPLSNLGSGLLVAFTQPLRLGDRISVGAETGFVEEMALIYTTLVTDDARRIFIPNTQLTTSMIVNRTIKDPRRLVAAQFPVSIETPIDEARSALHAAIAELPGTSGEDARVRVGEIGDRTVWLEAATYGPIDADVATLASDLRERGLNALRERGFLAG
jgi:small-conductance mechanosensitive channel